MERTRYLILLTLLAVMAGQCWSMSAEATISAQEVGVGEALQVLVKITEQKKVKDLPWPELKGDLSAFTVTKNSGTSSSTHTTIVNGRISKQTNYVTQFTYNLTAKKPGVYTIGPITYAHKTFRKNLGTTKVKVVKTEPGIKLVTSLSKSRVYVGEQVRYNLRIIPSSSVQGIQAPDFKKSIGEKFWMKQLDKEIKPKTVNINGKPTRVFDARFALFPLLAGRVNLSGFPVDYEQVIAQRRRGGRSVFDMFNSDFFGGRRVKKQAHSKAVSLQVTPLPGGAPAGFTNAVGQYQIRASVDKGTLPSGDALTLQIEISGNGQPKAITKPVLPDLSHFQVYTPETKASTKVVGGYFQSFKSFKFVLIPSRKGEFEIGPIKFPYFDPKAKAYKTAATAPISITVTQGKEIAGGTRILTQEDIKELGSDIRHIKKLISGEFAGDTFIYKALWYWGVFPLPPVIFLLTLFYRNRTRKLGEDYGLRRKVHAKGVARKRLSEARKAQQGMDPKAYYRSLVQAVERFISDKLNIEFRGMTIDAALATMKERGLPEEIQDAYRTLMETCDFGQFGRADKDAAAWDKAYAETESLINRLNKVL